MAVTTLCGILLVLSCKVFAEQLDEPECKKPDEVYGNAQLKTDLGALGKFTDGYEVRYRCRPGFVTSSSLKRTCSNGTWTSIECTHRFCPDIDDPENGKRLDINSFVGNRTYFRCNVGYIRLGPSSLMCRNDGEWRPSEPPVCDPVKCSQIASISNGRSFPRMTDEDWNIYGRVLTFDCDPGFILTGPKRLRCQADGTWSDVPPTCQVPVCPQLPPLYYGVIYYSKEGLQSPGDVAEVACNEGTDLFPEDFNGYVFCEGFEMPRWAVSDFTCEARHSVAPSDNMVLYVLSKNERRRGKRTMFGRETLKSRTKLSAECDKDYEIFDNKGNEYTDKRNYDFEVFNGTVKPAFPTCKGKRCRLEQCNRKCMYIGGYPPRGLVEHGVRVTKVCREEFEFEPEDLRHRVNYTSTCEKGQISFPECIQKRCEIPTGEKGDDIETYSPGDLVHSGLTVKKYCDTTQELYNSDRMSYLDSETFENTCKLGQWSKPDFPVCRNKRCRLERCDRECMYIDGYPRGGLVEHGEQVTKVCKKDYEFKQEKIRHLVNYNSICNKGRISFPECIPKRCKIPTGKKGNDIERYSPGDLVHDGTIVKKSCRIIQELYDIDKKSYLDLETFQSTCNVGHWSKPDFPVCWNRRCTIKGFNGTKLMSEMVQVIAGHKVPHGTILDIECVTGYENHGHSQASCNRGKLLKDAPCRPKSCHLPAIENSEHTSRTLDHGQTSNASCEPTHILMRLEDRSSVGFVETKCLFGNLTVTLDGFICEPRGCSPVPNAKYELLDNKGIPKSEWPSLFDHQQYASIKCNERFVLIRQEENKETPVNTTMTTQCVFGDWKPRYGCRKDTCEFELPKKAYLDVNGRKQTGSPKIDSGTKGKIVCNKGYHLYSENRSESYSSYPLQCTGNEISLPKLVCIRRCELTINDGHYYAYLNGKITEKTFIPSGEKVNRTCGPNHTLFRDGIDVDRGFAVQKCNNGKLRPTCECKLKVDEKKGVDGETETAANASSEVIPKVTSDSNVTITTLYMTTTAKNPTVPTTPSSENDVSNGDYDYSYEYDYQEEDDIGDHGTCSSPANGTAKRLFLDIYEVVCHQGFTLNNFDNNHQYECKNGKLLNDLNMEAKCMENKCVLSTELLSNMDVFGNRSRNEVFLSADSRFDPGRSLLFNCKTKNHEPVHRIFQCSKGKWIAADKDPSWFMDIENGNNSCRPAECNRCVFGDCVKDGICNCHQGATGKYCATAICHGDCKKNGGRCVRPNICICSGPRFGDNCEKVGCTLPQESDHLSFKKDGLPPMFEVGVTLPKDRITCIGDFLPSTNKDIHCGEGGKWSEDVSCIPAAIYEIEVTVGMGKWDGTWNTLNVSFINEKGQTTPRFPIQTSLFREQTYNAKIKTRYIGEIQRLHFTLHGRHQDNLGFQYISLKVTRGGQIEEYAIQGERLLTNQDNFNVDPGCPPPSTNGKLLRPKKRYIMGDKIQPNDVQCEPGYILSSTVTCMHNVKWSATCEKEADTTYTLTFSRTRRTRQKITVVLHGTRGSTKELALNHQGVYAASTFSRSWTLPSVGEINRMEVNVEDDSRSFAINYAQLIDQNRNLYYLSFHNGIFRGKNTLQVYDQFRPGCRGTTFLPEQNGYLKNNKLAKYHRISLWQNCEDLCRKDGSCTGFVVYKRLFKHCYLVSGYSLGQFTFASYNYEYKIYFRACS